MGYDLYGVSPVTHEVDEDKFPVYHKYNEMEWEEKDKIFKEDEKLSDQYWKEMEEREKVNPGVYFRNNVWWWRRLWMFTCHWCEDILDADDIAGGDSNSGHRITEDKALVIAKILQKRIDDGTAAEYEKEITERIKNADKDKNGFVKDFMDNYPFNVSNVQEFIKFCSESGGFEIC